MKGRSRSQLVVLVFFAFAYAGCPCKSIDRSYPAPSAEEILGSLATEREALRSFRRDSTMDYWVGKDRFRGTVLAMGELSAKVRMQALRPDDATAVDLSCDGASFVLVDHMNNCVLTGPCNAESIAQLLRVPLAPDDFLYLALGSTPVIDGAQGSVRWDDKHGREVLELKGSGGMTQTIIVDGRDGQKTWDLLKSEVRRGKDVVWTAEHKGYRELKGEDGQTYRVPSKSMFKSAADKTDVLIDWENTMVNPTLAPESFVNTEIPDVPMCGTKK
jgi:hypothetical protein